MGIVETLTPTEVAAVSCVSVREVNRVFDEGILPDALCFVAADGSRRLRLDACAWISFYFRTSDRLTSAQRQRTIATAVELTHRNPNWLHAWNGTPAQESVFEGWIIQDEFLSIDMAPFVTAARRGFAKLVSARKRIVKDHEILGGTPVIAGTRVPVYDVAASVSAGLPLERIESAYPSLTRDDIELATLYAAAYPPRGRPRRLQGAPANSVVVLERCLPRQSRSGS